MKHRRLLCVLAILLACALPCFGKSNHGKIRVLIVDGFSNHDWQQTTLLLRGILQAAGEFDVEVSTAPVELAPPPGRHGGRVLPITMW